MKIVDGGGPLTGMLMAAASGRDWVQNTLRCPGVVQDLIDVEGNVAAVTEDGVGMLLYN